MALIPAPVLAMKKLSINRAMEAQGFLASVNAIAESDAILHLEPSVLALRQDIATLGLKAALARSAGPRSQQLLTKSGRKTIDGLRLIPGLGPGIPRTPTRRQRIERDHGRDGPAAALSQAEDERSAGRRVSG